MRAIRNATISLGLVNLKVGVFKARRPSGLQLATICECGEKPKRPFLCDGCGARYAWHGAVPLRGLEVSKGEYITVPREDVEAVKAETRYDDLAIEAVVDLKTLTMRYGMGEKYYLLPPEDDGPFVRAYGVFAAALNEAGWAALTRITIRSKNRRWAIVSDGAVMVAYDVYDTRPIDDDLHTPSVTGPEIEQAKAILTSLVKEEWTFEADPDPVTHFFEGLVEERTRAEAGPVLTGDA